MTELSEQPKMVLARPVQCDRCSRVFRSGSIDHLCFDKNGSCQACQAELSGKYADGQGTALADLIIAARDLRQASKDYDDSNDCGEMYYAERISGPVDLLIDALDNYEGGGKR